MDNNNLIVNNDQIDQEPIKNDKKKTIISLLSVVGLGVVAGAGYLYLNDLNFNESDVDLEVNNKDINNINKNNNLFKKQIESQLEDIKKESELLKKENEKLREDAEIKSSEMRDFERKINSIQKNNSNIASKSISQKEIDDIVSRIESTTGEKFKLYEDKIVSLEKGILKNQENIKKTFQVSVGALSKIESIKKSNDETLKMMKTQIESLEKISSSIKNNENPIQEDVLKKINSLEDQINIIQKEKTVNTEVIKKEITLPLEIEVKNKVSTKNDDIQYQKNIENKKQVVKEDTQPKFKYYSVVGVFEDVVYLRDIENNDVISSYAVGDDLDGYGKILSISKDGKIKTEKGIVKYK